MSDQEYVIANDDSGHSYIIPLSQKDDFYKWIEKVEDYWRDPDKYDEKVFPGDVFEGAVGIDGGDVIFTKWRIG